MAATDGLTLRPFSLSDVPAACALNAEAGWNQVAADWTYMAGAGQGVAVDGPDGRLIATGMLLPYGSRFGWIAMILVTRGWQRRGLATRIMRHCIERSGELGLVAGLDATEQGRPVYLPLGFHDVYALSRLAAERPRAPAVATAGVRALNAADLNAVAAYDSAVFGADRSAVLTHLSGRRPDLALICERAGDIAGYMLARDGRVATQFGPLVADDEAAASALLSAALERVDGPVFLDLADRHAELRAMLERAGFARQRGYVRMLLERGHPIDDPARTMIIAGPELA